MRIVKLAGVVSVLAAAAFTVNAETLNTTMKVNLPYAVTVGSTQLSPGNYVIREVSDVSKIFAIYNNDGTVATFVQTVPTEQLNAPERTNVVLRGDGHEYVMDEMWFAGQNTGFHFLNSDETKSRLKERSAIQIPAVKSGL